MTTPLDIVRTITRDIGPSVEPTFKLYISALLQVKDRIRQPYCTYQYGPDARQQLDVYLPPTTAPADKLPVFVFFYGGGIRDGDRGGDARFPDSLGLIYANLGTFFADRGFVTIVSDYRTTTSHPKLTFPQGAEDVSLTLEWLATHADLAHANLSNVFVAGNSAGGTHLQGFLWTEHPTIKTQEALGLKMRAAILMSSRSDYDYFDPYRTETLYQYFGGPDGIKRHEPRTYRLQSADTTPVLSMVAELDPEDEMIQPINRFRDLYKGGRIPGNPPPPEEMLCSEHNHISLPLGLMLGGREDAWGQELVRWMRARLA